MVHTSLPNIFQDQ